MKLVRFEFTCWYVFVDLKVHNVEEHSYHFDRIDQKNVALIYSITICQKKTKDCAP